MLPLCVSTIERQAAGRDGQLPVSHRSSRANFIHQQQVLICDSLTLHISFEDGQMCRWNWLLLPVCSDLTLAPSSRSLSCLSSLVTPFIKHMGHSFKGWGSHVCHEIALTLTSFITSNKCSTYFKVPDTNSPVVLRGPSGRRRCVTTHLLIDTKEHLSNTLKDNFMG